MVQQGDSNMVKKNKRKKKEIDVQKTMNMFDKIPNNCLICNKGFNKTDKQMVKEWKVIVKNEPASVKLYCPDCWEQAQTTLEYINKQHLVEEKDTQQGAQPKNEYGSWAYNLSKVRKK